jgi:hypothetical protein
MRQRPVWTRQSCRAPSEKISRLSDFVGGFFRPYLPADQIDSYIAGLLSPVFELAVTKR